MNHNTEDFEVSDEELRKHWISMVTPPRETEAEVTWVEPEPITLENKKKLSEIVASRAKNQTDNQQHPSEIDLLFNLVKKKKNPKEDLHGEKEKREGAEETETVETQKTDLPKKESKIVIFRNFLIPLAIAATLTVIFVPFGGNKFQYDEVVYGDWSDSNLMRGGEVGNESHVIPAWVSTTTFSDKNEREAWLSDENSGNRQIKVWVDEDLGCILIQRPGSQKVEEVPLDLDKGILEQLLETLNSLKKEIESK